MPRPPSDHRSPAPPSDPAASGEAQPDGSPPTPQTTPRTAAPSASPIQIWGRSLVIGVLLGLFIGFAFGRGETARVIALMVIIAIIATLIVGGLITWANRSRTSRNRAAQ